GEESSYPYTGSIYSFAPPAGSGSQHTIASGLSFEPKAMAFDTNGDLFEADGDNGNIYEFTNNAGSLSTTPTQFAPDYGTPGALAFDSSGDLLLGAGGEVAEFPNIGGTLSPD